MIDAINEKELINLAMEAGFISPEDACGLSGDSAFDMSIYCDEYPVGESIKRLVESLGIAVMKEAKQ